VPDNTQVTEDEWLDTLVGYLVSAKYLDILPKCVILLAFAVL
jgi:hypothetical protein